MGTGENFSTQINADELASHCDLYKGAFVSRSLWQLFNSVFFFFCALAVMTWGLEHARWLTALLVLPAAGFLVRLFIIQHDCGHGSFFNKKWANDLVGRSISVLTFTPYDFWRRAHNMHHASSGDLDRRSVGGIDTVTVKEYNELPADKKIAYRIYRNPFILLLLGTPLYTIFVMRLPLSSPPPFFDNYQGLSFSSIWPSVLLTNISLVLCYGSAGYLLGLEPLLFVYLPVLIVTTWIGGWLFFIQHQFEETYWKENKDWRFKEAALLSSSYYVLPKFLQWFTGNIGLHHIHHLCSKIPNYRLQECLDDNPALQNMNRLTLRDSLHCARLALWDEDRKKLVSFAQARAL